MARENKALGIVKEYKSAETEPSRFVQHYQLHLYHQKLKQRLFLRSYVMLT